MAVADPRFAPEPPKPPPKWVQAGLSKSQWDKLDYTEKQIALLKAQDQGINPTGDEALPITYGPALLGLGRMGLNRVIATKSPKPGHVRLWRGEGKPSPKRNKNDWVSQSVANARKKPPKFRTEQEKHWINQADAAKRWYGGPGKKEVDFYLREYKNPLLRYIDVPKAVADKYHLPNMALKPGGKWTPHNPRAYSRNPTQEWYFPPRADAILQSSRVYRPPLPPFQPSSVAPPLALPFMEP